MRILLVANRLPIAITRKKNHITAAQSPGGVATGLKAFADSLKESKNITTLWLGWPGVSGEKKLQDEIEIKLKPLDAYPIFIPDTLFSNYYEGFCNKVIWPLFHYFPEHCVNKNTYWEDYKKVNKLFCEKIVQHYKKGDIIFIHDYQLLLLPQMVREALPDAKIGFFLHIPFPNFEVFRMMPTEWQKDIITGVLGANLVGFHTHEYTQYFLDCAQRIAGAQNTTGTIQYGKRLIQASTFPLGIDYERFANAFSEPETQKEYKKLKQSLAGQQVVLSIDRLDYSKGILNRLKAFELFLIRNPSFRKKTTLILILVLSRTGIGDYKLMKKQIDEYIGKINGRFGDIDWTPILYQSRSLDFHKLIALYNSADVALVTPLRDGMNLIAKEYVASRKDNNGVLILSELAGAAKEVSEAVIVNPFSKYEISDAIRKSLVMDKKERIRRNTLMKNRLQKWSVRTWGESFMNALEKIITEQQLIKIRRLTTTVEKSLITSYNRSTKRLFFIDYDGTLRKFVNIPEKAKPTRKLLLLLESLARDPRNDVFITSGRDAKTLEDWFGHLSIGLIAEHGGELKLSHQKWHKQTNRSQNPWKDTYRKLIATYVDRIPGSFIEEKTYSLVWHYRMADPLLADIVRKELVHDLLELSGNSKLQVLEGSKNVEIKNSEATKGTAAKSIIRNRPYDFIISIGDDRTDEDMFEALSDIPYATNIKVGFEPSLAHYMVKDVSAVLSFLAQFSDQDITYSSPLSPAPTTILEALEA